LRVITLDLPEPPRQGGGRSRHWRGQWAKINAYKRSVWLAAIQQQTPSRKPPEKARVALQYRLWARRDPSNLYADAKPLLDALKQRPASRDKLRWKAGVYLDRGYFVDDDYLEFGSVTQEVDRNNRGVTVTIEPIG
jgi:hypothetical protein